MQNVKMVILKDFYVLTMMIKIKYQTHKSYIMKKMGIKYILKRKDKYTLSEGLVETYNEVDN